MVGALLVHQNRVIGEGYHEYFGGPHAEVNCIASVAEQDQHLISLSTLYVSLEPCAHFGKTPPCADLVISQQIPRVVIGCRDPFTEVNGRGVEKLKNAGIGVVENVMEEECRKLNESFFCYHSRKKPFVVLKWAETGDGKIARSTQGNERLLISDPYSQRLVHQWRSELAAVLVGRKTALHDDPQLNLRLWPGQDPVRLVIDPQLQLPGNLAMFNGNGITIVFNYLKDTLEGRGKEWRTQGVHYCRLTKEQSLPAQILDSLYQLGIQSLLVEGGAFLLQSFINDGAWDEARVIVNEKMILGEGLPAPQLKDETLVSSSLIRQDQVKIYRKK
jgi:diaminohydroxyphosphoribosylaminopyrimidine deaminase / 5-amino-6-(5-phosphoribosylamino)uracil reductase